MPLGPVIMCHADSYSTIDVANMAFSKHRRDVCQYQSFDVNTFVADVMQQMTEKHQEYKNAFVKSFTRFEEKCDFIDTVIFPAVKAWSENQTDENTKKMVDAFEIGVKQFTTFGKMSGIAKIFESAYFAMTTIDGEVSEYDHTFCEYRMKPKIVVSAKSANFVMSDETRCVVYGDQPKVVTNKTKPFDSNKPVMGIPVAPQYSSGDAVTGVPVVDAGFFNMMRSVRVPQHHVGVVADTTSRVIERTPCNA